MADINDKIKKPSNDKQKSLKMSTRLQERAQQSLADNLPAVSHPAQSEPLDVGAIRSMDYTITNTALKSSSVANEL